MSSNKYKIKESAVPIASAVLIGNDVKHPSSKNISKPNAIIESAVSASHKKKQSNVNHSIESGVSIYNPPNELKTKEYLTSHKWPLGLQLALIKSLKKIPIRFIITDDSGSMMTNDGHRLIGQGTKNVKMIQCTRWSELTSSLKFHAELAHASKSPTEFRLLNNSEPILVGMPKDLDGKALEAALNIFEESPSGQTPICYHIGEVVRQIQAMESQLRENKQQACVVIATDGEATDGDIAEAMKPLQYLPVWVVIRLCTDEDHIVEYWNNIDSQLELEMDVLDDLTGEAHEVHESNPWMTYSDPLQKLREFGATVKEMDLLDESALSSEQMKVICGLLVMGEDVKTLPHPDEEWDSFLSILKTHNTLESPVYDPVTKTIKQWLDIPRLNDMYNGNKKTGSFTCVVC